MHQLVDGNGAEQSRVTVTMRADRSLHLLFEPLDFGGPRLPDVTYHLDANTVARAQLELGLLGREVFDDPASFVRVVLTQFDSLRQGMRWLREAGVWVQGPGPPRC
ncbi:hypothetical protein [Leptothrix discophora]|uniref:Uncharacterized protein n=1 Tax=Leptothrix discophora TaxID=89 RepID=A0ABT9G0W3_LEPDI|nr:hypothetical protein [Leptothrix discophora]MDP4300026.1 hypothetical protein [Leptothrix discophora]